MRSANARMPCTARRALAFARVTSAYFAPAVTSISRISGANDFGTLPKPGIATAGPIRCVVQRRLAVTAGGIWIGTFGQQRTDNLWPVFVGGDDEGGVASVVATIGVRSGFDQGDGYSRLRAREREIAGD